MVPRTPRLLGLRRGRDGRTYTRRGDWLTAPACRLLVHTCQLSFENRSLGLSVRPSPPLPAARQDWGRFPGIVNLGLILPGLPHRSRPHPHLQGHRGQSLTLSHRPCLLARWGSPDGRRSERCGQTVSLAPGPAPHRQCLRPPEAARLCCFTGEAPAP